MSYESLARLPDPTTNPPGPGFVSQQLLDNTPGMVHNLNNGGSIYVKFSGSYWTITITYPQMTIQESSALMSFIYNLQGGFTNFYVQLPTMANPVTGAWGPTAIVAGDVFSDGLLSNEIGINNWNNRGAGNDISVGDLIKLSNHNKIYLVTNKVLTNTDTKAILTLNCDIFNREQVAAATIEPNDIKFKVRQVSSPPSFTLTPDGLYAGVSLSLRENVL